MLLGYIHEREKKARIRLDQAMHLQLLRQFGCMLDFDLPGQAPIIAKIRTNAPLR